VNERRELALLFALDESRYANIAGGREPHGMTVDVDIAVTLRVPQQELQRRVTQRPP
jgi:hypothetical protein